MRIHLDLLEWFTRFHWLVRALRGIEDASQLAQDFPDGPRGAWRDNALSLQVRIAVQIIEDSARSRNTLQILSRGSTDLDDALDQA